MARPVSSSNRCNGSHDTCAVEPIRPALNVSGCGCLAEAGQEEQVRELHIANARDSGQKCPIFAVFPRAPGLTRRDKDCFADLALFPSRSLRDLWQGELAEHPSLPQENVHMISQADPFFRTLKYITRKARPINADITTSMFHPAVPRLSRSTERSISSPIPIGMRRGLKRCGSGRCRFRKL